MRIVYFTAGTVGAGHYVRGCALGRALGRAGFGGEYRMVGPALDFPVARSDARLAPVDIDYTELTDAARAAESALGRRLAELQPDLLVVDLFWAPLRYVLPRLGVPAWLLLRRVPPVWLTGPPEAPFAPEQFERIIAIEPLADLGVATHIDPMVIANPDECRPAGALRERLGLDAQTELTVVAHAGAAGEIGDLDDGAHVVADLHDPAALFPIAEWLGGADRIVAAAGYNAYWEARWLGYFDRVVFKALPRRIDDQAWRLRVGRAWQMRHNGADTLASWILAG